MNVNFLVDGKYGRSLSVDGVSHLSSTEEDAMLQTYAGEYNHSIFVIIYDTLQYDTTSQILFP